MTTKGQRKKWTAEEKLRIVLTGMQPGVEVADLCRREGLNPAAFYLWKKQLLCSARPAKYSAARRAGRATRRSGRRRRCGG